MNSPRSSCPVSRKGSVRRRPVSMIVGAAYAVAFLTACVEATPESPPVPVPPSTAAPSPDPSSSPEAAEPSVVVTGLDAPWSIAFHGDTPLVSERDTGRVIELDSEGNSREIAVVADAVARGEGGLLGIATEGEHLYAYFTTREDNRIVRYPIEGEPGVLSLGTGETLLDGIPAANHHNGGRIAFGPDGMLYATTGDAGDVGTSQDLDSLAGKILRLTPAGDVPDDNPFTGSYVYSYGHRNPQGIAWADDGTMYSSEFGQNTWDELNVIEAGANYGWPEAEGIAGRDGFVDPVQQWPTSDASPSGIAIHNDAVWIANLRGERLRAVPLADPSTSFEYFAGELGRLRDIAIAPDGRLWLLTNNTDGRGEPRDGDDRIVSVDGEF